MYRRLSIRAAGGGRRCGPARRGSGFAAALVLASGIVLAGPVADAAARETAPGSPGVPQAPAVVFAEDFEYQQDAVPRLITDYTGAPPLSQEYIADPAWLTGCNGWIVSPLNADSGPPGSGCGPYWAPLEAMASALGQWSGGDAASNHAVAAYTEGNPGAGKVELETVKPIPLEGENRFLTFSVDAAARNCFAAHPLLEFYLLDGDTAIPTFTSPINPCTDPDQVIDGTAVGTYAGNSAALFSGSSAGVRLVNAQASGTGNDGAFDNVRLLDATPQLDIAFGPTTLPAGSDSTLTLTITNTSEKAAKNGWSFTEQLPQGLVLSDPSTATTTCGAGTVTLSPAGDRFTATGNLAAGQDFCTVQVEVTSARGASYTLCAAATTERVGVDPPGCATVTFGSLAMDAHAYGARVDALVDAVPPIAPSDVTCTQDPATDEAGVVGASLGSLGSLGVVRTEARGTVGVNGARTATAKATTAQVSLLGGTITAKEITATATATGSVTPEGIGPVATSGSSTLTGTVIAGVTITSHPAPNTGIGIPLVGSVTLNEQKPYGNGKGIIVNALHVKLLTGVHVIVSGTRASLSPTPGPCPVP